MGVPASQIQEIAMDMSRAFIAEAGEHFPEAQLCFDRFDVMKLCGESLDQIRKEVAREQGGLPRWGYVGVARQSRKPQGGAAKPSRANL